jgi:mannose-6-phosphate isomerase-like protein (cupin superfamily)
MLNNQKNITPTTIRDLLATKENPLVSQLEVDKTELALQRFAEAYAQQPPLSMRDTILNKINKLNHQARNRQKISLDAVPLLTPDANWLDWQAAVAHINPPDDYDGVHLHPIREDNTVQIFVAFVKEHIDEEVHFDLRESFILLEGSCECLIKNEKGTQRIVHMREGDRIEFQLGEIHDIYITSVKPAKAILQWLQLAA